MASIRKRGNKYHVQVRRVGQASVTKSFLELRDAKAWARLMEVKADKGALLADPKILKQTTLGEILGRYRDTVSPKKRSHETERFVLSAFLLHRSAVGAYPNSAQRTSPLIETRDCERSSQVRFAANLQSSSTPSRPPELSGVFHLAGGR